MGPDAADAEDFYMRGQDHLTEILAGYQGGTARTPSGQKLNPSESELTHILLEQYFNSQIFSWALLTCAVYAYTLGHVIFHKFLCDKLLVWDAVEGDTENDRVKRKSRRMMLLNQFISHNYLYVIFWYWFTDMATILPTSFDILFFFTVYFQQSLVYSCHKIVESFIANVIDAQITMTTTVNLQTNKQFHDRVHKVIAFQAILSWSASACAIFTLFLLWNFEEARDVYELITSFPLAEYMFLAYPALMTYIDVMKQQKTFIGKLRDSKTMCIVSQESNQVKEEIPSPYDSLIYVLRTEFLGQHHTFNFEKVGGEAKPSLSEYAEQDDLAANGSDEGQKQDPGAKQLTTLKDNDKAKIDLIKSEFVLDFLSDSINLLHLSLLIIIRGLNVSIFNHFFLGQ